VERAYQEYPEALADDLDPNHYTGLTNTGATVSPTGTGRIGPYAWLDFATVVPPTLVIALSCPTTVAGPLTTSGRRCRSPYFHYLRLP
jgi:hypothetical protein